MKLLIVLLSIIILANSSQDHINVSNKASIDNITVNGSALTLTSMLFNSASNNSFWVERIFGSKSIYNSFDDFTRFRSSQPISVEERFNMTKAITDKINLTYYELFPDCSFEFLGFAHMGIEDPITVKNKLLGPIIGNSILTVNRLSINISCYYRALYESWKAETDRSKPNHWAIVFYCPILSPTTCLNLNSFISTYPNELVTMNMDMLLNQVVWSNSFSSRLKRYDINNSSNQIGICVAIPYSSSDREKHIGNAAMLREWIEYYVKLDMKVFIYDRSGNNYDSVYNNGIDSKLHDNIVYYNYTMRGLLNPHLPYLLYDNNEQMGPTVETKQQARTVGERFARQGVDKALTLTQCRFEAKVNFGIETIIVADFDEFLYCPSSDLTSQKTLKETIREVIKSYSSKGIEQIEFAQKVIANKTESMRDCIIEKAKQNVSLFNCITSNKFIVSSHSIKSIHLGHKCPLTGYHQACPTSSFPRSNDCDCVTSNIYRVMPCIFVHLSTKNDHYKKFHMLFHSSEILNEMIHSNSELLSI